MGRRRPTRRAGSGDNHDARLAILEHRFPESMRARCSGCGTIHPAREGEWVEVFLSSPGSGVLSTHIFRCCSCESTAERQFGTRILAVPRQSRPTLERHAQDLRGRLGNGGEAAIEETAEEQDVPSTLR